MRMKSIWRLTDLVLLVVSLWILQIGFLGYLVVFMLNDVFWRYKLEGCFNLIALKQLHGEKKANLDNITHITGTIRRNTFFPTNVLLEAITVDQKIDITLDDREILELAKTRLNNWVIDSRATLISNHFFTIMPGLADEKVCVIYNSVGKYAMLPYISSLVFPPFCFLALAGITFGLINVSLFLTLLLIPFFDLIPSILSKVAVKLDSQGVTLQEGDCERFLPFNEVAKLEKGIFRIRVTARDGEVFYFPKACYLLAELIQTFTIEANERLTTRHLGCGVKK